MIESSIGIGIFFLAALGVQAVAPQLSGLQLWEVMGITMIASGARKFVYDFFKAARGPKR